MELRIDDPETSEYDTLGEHVRELHERMMRLAPSIKRVACVLYDSTDDTLKTFVNSTRDGEALRSYEAKLADSYSLSALAASGESRVLTDLPRDINTGTTHSNWVIGMGYQSSLTIPLKFKDRLLGFLFFDSMEGNTFTTEIVNELTLYGKLIGLAIANELIVIRSILGSVQVAREVGKSDEWVEDVFLYSPLHDIGKIGIPDRILLKPGRLDEDEWAIMKTHTTIGLELVDAIVQRLAVQNLGATAIMRNIVELHHEALDGSGYPNGYAGDEIPLEAQVVAVADIFDALTSRRPYKREWTFEEAFAELHRLVERGKLRADCVAAFERRREELQSIHDRFKDEALVR